MSFGSGGIGGLGLGKGLQILYLPEAHTDFVGAVIGEELGFIGVCVLCFAYVVLVARGVRAAFKAPDDYGTYLAFGFSTLFAVQALVNLAVAMSLLPTKGLTLPFISFGGSSLLVNALAAGILLNVTRHVEGRAAVEQEHPNVPDLGGRAAPQPSAFPPGGRLVNREGAVSIRGDDAEVSS
jgi:cell division protein FtsW